MQFMPYSVSFLHVYEVMGKYQVFVAENSRQHDLWLLTCSYDKSLITAGCKYADGWDATDTPHTYMYSLQLHYKVATDKQHMNTHI